MKVNDVFKTVILVAVLSLSGRLYSTYTLDHAKITSEPNRILPEKLRGINIGILGTHSPNPTLAEFEDNIYIWKHDTAVKAMYEDLEIVEYGSYIYTDAGWYHRVAYTPQDFEKYYNCPNAILKKDVVYTDPASWRKSEELFAGDALWYYIARNKAGKLFKGLALIETEADLVSENVEVFLADTKKSTVEWTGYGEGGNYSLTGSVKLKYGKMKIADDRIKSGKFVIDLTTITHNDKTLQEHLKGDDFFNVAKYPEAVLNIINSKMVRKDVYEVEGEITIKNKTEKVMFTMQRSKSGYYGSLELDRVKFDIRYGSKSFFDNLGDQAIKNVFKIDFNIVKQ
ncbi:YceI family protein [Flavobacterium sp. D11R37]|uniref:YceI family protein n=1 Tax=Flavobacterium coralii TaxID=2838017 RepID=UPI001CA74763|nr:YceI family protein [Flavobacterium coralii]MBY8963208.1 YceI family protein [Flavobacterium coralii]